MNDKVRDLLVLGAVVLVEIGAYLVHPSLAFLLGGVLLFVSVLLLWPRDKGDEE